MAEPVGALLTLWTRARRLGRRRWLPAAALGGLVALFFAPVLFAPRAFFLKDAQLVFYPVRLAFRERFLAGDLPQWLPELDLGLPLLGDPANSILYPLTLILLLPAPWSINVFIVVHFLLGVTGAWALLRDLRLRRTSAAFGALGFVLGGYMVSLTWIPNYVMSLGWMPWVSWAALRTIRRRRAREAAWTALLLGVQVLSGEPQGVVLTGWLVLSLLIAYPMAPKERLRAAGLLAASAAVGACVAMPLILPTLELLPRSRRAQGIDLVQASHWSLHPLRLLELAVPWLWGNPIRFDEFLGFFMNDEGFPLHRDPWVATPYFGSIALPLLASASIVPRRRQRWWVRALGVLSLLTLFLSLGRHTPVFAAYFQLVPGASLFRYPAKFWGLLAATLPFMAAAGIDSLRGGSARSRRWFVGTWIALLFAMGSALLFSAKIAAPLTVLRPTVALASAETTVETSLLTSLSMLGFAGLAVLWIHRFRRRLLGLVAVGALGVQLGADNFEAYETAQASIYRRPALASRILRETPASHLPRVFHQVPALDLPNIDSWPGTLRASALNASLMKNVGVPHGIHYAKAYVSADEGPKRRLWKEAAPWQRALIDGFGVTYVVLPKAPRAEPSPGLVPLPGADDLGVAVYRNERAVPFAFAAASFVSVQKQREALQALASPAVSRGMVVALENPPLQRRQKSAARPGSCRPTSAVGDTIDLDCTLERESWVVVNASHHPNWKATVDGRAAEIVRANAFVMAVFVPAGRRHVQLVYAEPSLPIGFAVMACGLILAIGLTRLGQQRPAIAGRRGSAQPPPPG